MFGRKKMGILLSTILFVFISAGVSFSSSVRLKEIGNLIKVDNGRISAYIHKSTGRIVRLTKEKGNEIFSYQAKEGIYSLLLFPALPDVLSPFASTPISQDKQKTSFKTLSSDEAKVTFELNLSSDLAETKQLITILKDTDYIKVSFEIRYKKPAYEAVFVINKLRGIDYDNCIVYPFKGRAIYKALYPPCYFSLINPGKKEGLNIFVPENTDIDRIGCTIRGKPEKSETGSDISLRIKYLQGKSFYKGSFYIAITSSPQGILGIWEKVDNASFKKKPEAELIEIEIDKLIHKPNEEGLVRAIVQNNTPEEEHLWIELSFESQIDKLEKITSKKFSLSPYETKTVEIPFNSGKEKYGVEAIATLKKGNSTIDTISDTFFVIDYWPQIFQKAIFYPEPNSAIWDVAKMRQNYITVGHVFCWYPKRNVLAFDDERYASHQRGMIKYKQAFIDFVKECRKRGVKSSFYYGMEAAIPGDLDFAIDPTRLMYNKDGQAMESYHGTYYGNIYAEDFRDWLAEQFIKSIEMFGWDSVFIDCITVLGDPKHGAYFYYQYFDYQGNPIGKPLAEDFDTAGALWLNELKKRVRKVYPGFVFMGNGIGPGDTFLETSGLGPKVYEAGEIMLCELGGGGVAISTKGGVGQWQNLRDCLNSTAIARRKMNLDKFPHYVMMPAQYGGEITMKACAALVFANGVRFYTWWSRPKYELFGEAMSQYYRFMTRYSAYIYHQDMNWIDKEKVDFISIPDKKNLFWKEYCYRKDTAQSKELIIHLVNLPKNRYVWRITDYPEVYRDIPVSIDLKRLGFEPKEVWLLSPDMSKNAVKLRIKKESGSLKFTIPEILFYNIVVVKGEAKI